MDQTMRHLEDAIHRERRDLDRNLNELQDQARAMTDWRTHYRNHPWAALGAATGVGFLLAVVTSSGDRGGRARPTRSLATATSSAFSHLDRNGNTTSRIQDTWDTILDGLLGVASAAAVGFVSQHVPGFREQYDSAQKPHQASRTGFPPDIDQS